MQLDPAALAVLLARLAGVADEMLAVLRRSASSPNIKERADCSTALFTAGGELLAQSESIPVHLGSMPESVRSVVDALGALSPGEQAVVNDPYAGGTHLNDVTVVAPVHVEGRLAGWVASRAHHADVGGAEPGSIPADATHIAEEGLRLPPIRLTDEVRAVFLAASRTPEERAGDLDAQVGANRLGVERLAEILTEGWPVAEVLGYGERRMRAALAALPDGSWSFDDVLDSVGAGLPAGRVAVRVTIAHETIEFDFAGTDQQSPGNVNAVRAVTESAVAFALRSATDPTIPANGGALRPVHVVTPPGSLVAASWPAAVGAGNVEVSQRIADVCLGALAQVAAERVGAASQGTMNNVLIGGSAWVYYETIGGGQGGRPHGPGGMSGVHTGMTNTSQVDAPSRPPKPGMSGVHTGMTNTRSTPTEALERAYPMRVRRFRLRRGSGGAGLAAGGEGIERELEVLEDCTLSLITERRVSAPWGLAGGSPGAVGENWLLPGGDEARAERLPDKCTVRLRAGDVLRVLTPGGGGWGVPEGGRAEESSEGRESQVELIPMDATELEAFLGRSRADYLAELVEGGMAADAAAAKVDEEQSAAFPGGRPASGHRVFVVRRGDRPVGHLWLGPAPDDGPGSWWVWEVRVDEAARGHGVGRRTMELAEVQARRAGATSLGLSVSGGNDRARRLYESLGYEPSSVRMRKPLV